MKRVALSSIGVLLIVGTILPWRRPEVTPQLEAKLQPSSALVRHDLAASALAGELIGFELTPVRAAVTGILLETYFYEGQFVQKGQLLAKLWVRAHDELAYVSAPQSGVITHANAPIREVWPAAKPLLSLTNPTRLHVRLTRRALSAVGLVQLHDSLSLQLANGSAAAVPGQVVQLDTSAEGVRMLTLQLTRPLAGAVAGSAVVITRAAAPKERLETTALGR